MSVWYSRTAMPGPALKSMAFLSCTAHPEPASSLSTLSRAACSGFWFGGIVTNAAQQPSRTGLAARQLPSDSALHQIICPQLSTRAISHPTDPRENFVGGSVLGSVLTFYTPLPAAVNGS